MAFETEMQEFANADAMYTDAIAANVIHGGKADPKSAKLAGPETKTDG